MPSDERQVLFSGEDYLSIISSYFNAFALGMLKVKLRLLFADLSFLEQMAELKDPKKFVPSSAGTNATVSQLR
jgi:hypothetical protein